VPKDSGNSDGKGGGSQQPPNAQRKNNVLPIDRGRRVPGRAWPISGSGLSMNSAAGLLIVIGVLCGLLISETDNKSSMAGMKADVGPQKPAPATSVTPAAAAKPAKPSPAVKAAAVRPAPSAVAVTDARNLTRTPSYTPAKFQATHKKAFGGCSGELELTSTALHFRCPKSDLDLPIDEIAKAHKDGVVLKSGEKYHFAIANHSKDQAEAIFISWLSRVQPAAEQKAAF